MPTVKCILRKDQPDKDGLCKIIIIYSHGRGKVTKFTIGEKVLISHFNNTNGHVVSSHPRSREINHLIDTHKTTINNIVFDLKRKGIDPSTESIKRNFENYFSNYKKNDVLNTAEPNLNDISVNNAWNELMTLKQNIWSTSTTSIYRTTFNHLINYCSQHDQNLSWELFDVDFSTHWNNYFLEECENQYGDVGLMNNTIGKYIKTLKQFLNWAVKKEYHSNFRYKSYKIYSKEGDIFPLSERHLSELVKFCDNPKNSLRLRKCASIFIFLSSTGLRFSDGQGLLISDFHYSGEGGIESQVFKLTSKKTNQKLTIPLNPYSIKELIRWFSESNKNNTSFLDILKSKTSIFDNNIIRKLLNQISDFDQPILPQISSVKFNKYIKEVGEKCGFTEPITLHIQKGNKTEKKSFKRWEKLSSHDCRRTFITLSLQKGMRPEILMEITGHTSYKTMLRYNKIENSIMVKEFNSAWGESIKVDDGEIGTFTLGVIKSKNDKNI